MLISTGKRFVFVANTKTASTSIEELLRPHADIVLQGNPQRKHMPLARALRDEAPFANGADPASYFKFGVMRDPLEWIGSWFRYRRGNQVAAPLPPEMDFAAFWQQADWNLRRGDGSRYLQSDLFLDHDGQLLADVIIPYDQLDTMMTILGTALGLPALLPRSNVSALTDTGPLPPELRDEMRTFYASDYALLERLDQINASGLARLRAGLGGFAAPVS